MKSAKIHIFDPQEDTKVPFLRGILIKSLQNVGLDFEDAYHLASLVRRDLESKSEIKKEQLYDLVCKHLKSLGNETVLSKYTNKNLLKSPIQVSRQGQEPEAFSQSKLVDSLNIAFPMGSDANRVANSIRKHLQSLGTTEIKSNDLAEAVYQYLEENEGEQKAKDYAVWLAFLRSGRPLFLLIGGATGTGKSTIASEIAHKLNIVRTQSTDMLREVIRLMVPPRLIPAIHHSSFLAWQSLPGKKPSESVDSDVLEQGYLTQSEQVALGIEAVLDRAVRENVSLILEGVHIYPELQAKMLGYSEAIVVPIMLSVLKKKRLKLQLRGRNQALPSRRSERYVKHFDMIWQLQSYLTREADVHNIPLIENLERSDTIQMIVRTILDWLSKEFGHHSPKGSQNET